MQEPLALQPGKSSLWIIPLLPQHGFQTGDRTPTIEDKDRFAVLHLVDECAQVVLGLGQGGSLHLARIAIFPLQLNELIAAEPNRGERNLLIPIAYLPSE